MTTETKVHKIFDPAQEEKRDWLRKKQELPKNRLRTAELLMCTFCPTPIGPDDLIIDRGGERACVKCGNK